MVIFVVLFVEGWLVNSRVGWVWEVICEDEDVAEFMGVLMFCFKLLAFFCGVFIGGLFGVLFVIC